VLSWALGHGAAIFSYIQQTQCSVQCRVLAQLRSHHRLTDSQCLGGTTRGLREEGLQACLAHTCSPRLDREYILPIWAVDIAGVAISKGTSR
jgi:hypothetical protein